MPESLRRLHPTLVAAALSLSGGVANAFEADDILVYKFGQLSLKPQFDQSTQYTDNLFYGNDSVYAQFNDGSYVLDLAGNKVLLRPQEDDILLTFSPGLSLRYGDETPNWVSLDYMFDEVLYTGHSEHNTQQHHIDLRSQFELGKFRLTGTDSFQFLSSFMGGGFYTDPTRPGPNQLQIDRLQTTVSHRLLFDYSDKTDAYVDFLYADTDFEDSTSLYDINDLRGTFGGTYKYSEKLGFFVEGFYGQTATNPNRNGTKPPHSDVYGGFIGARGEFTPKLAGSLKVGYEQREFPNLTTGADTPAVEVALNYSPGPLTGLALSYSRRTGTSVQFAQQSYVYDGVALSLNQQLGTSGKWVAIATARYDRGEFDPYVYPPLGAYQLLYPTRIDNTLMLSAGVKYQPQPWCTVSLAYEFERFDSDAVYFQRANGVVSTTPVNYLVDYDAHRVILKFSFGY